MEVKVNKDLQPELCRAVCLRVEGKAITLAPETRVHRKGRRADPRIVRRLRVWVRSPQSA